MAAIDEAASVKIVGSYAECVAKMVEYANKYNVYYSADFPRTPHNAGCCFHALPAGWMTVGGLKHFGSSNSNSYGTKEMGNTPILHEILFWKK
jgi:hypothetical protein